MKFKLIRTSLWVDEKPLQDNRVKKMMFKNWKREEWGIELNTFDELMEFIKEDGPVVIMFDNDTWLIEIYDDYRE